MVVVLHLFVNVLQLRYCVTRPYNTPYG